MGEIMSDIKDAVRMAAKAKALKNDVARRSVAASAQDSIFQFPCLVSNTVPVDMATAVTRMLDRTYASFVQIVLSNVGNVDLSIDPNPTAFLTRKIHQNMNLESVNEEENPLFEGFYDGREVIAINPIRGLAISFEAYNGSRNNNLRQLNLEASREFLSDFDLIPIMEADDITTADVLSSAIQANMDKNARDRQNLSAAIGRNKQGPQLMDRDVKKANDLMPYAIQVRLNVINDKQEFVDYWDVVVGVKTILHLIRSEEMVDNLARAFRGNSKVFNFIRWTTGEISFVKDLLLHIDDIKFDMKNMQNGYSSWFPTLKRLKDRKVNFRNITPNMNVPTSTVVISSYEVDELEKKYGIMIKDAVIANKIMDSLMLMGFVIVDSATNTLEVLFNDNKIKHGNSFETYSLETINREVAQTKNGTALNREIGRMIGAAF